jgi:hypothetical protein
MTDHVFEFIALECVRQNEPGGDEVYIRYGSEKVHPPGRGLVDFVAGGVLVNKQAGVPSATLMEFLGRRGCREVADDPSTAEFRQTAIPQQGLVVEVMEHDLWTRHDRIGRILVSQRPTGGPVLHVFDTVQGHYRLTYQVLAEQDAEAPEPSP